MIGRVAVMLALAASGAAAQEAVAPKLTAATPAVAAREAGAAQPVPSTVAICIDRSARRCWTAVDSGDCTVSATAELFATVAAGSADAGSRLRTCWDTFE